MIDFTGFTKEKLTIDLVWANVFGLLILLPIVIIYGLPYFLIWGDSLSDFSFGNVFHTIQEQYFGNSLHVVLYLLGGIIAHELIHGIFWSLFAEHGFNSIRFGVMWKMLTPYCHCKEPLQIKHYIIGALMPAVILGLFPAIVGIAIGDLGMVIFGGFFTLAAAGDFLIINLLKKESMNDLVQDHPTEAGCFVYRKA
tara:strand:+ start:105708 stop:106295 length:588 start_codon:yes stop_codon:yes gene_type:complete